MILFVVSEIGKGYSRRIERAVGRKGCHTSLVTWRDFDYNVVRRLDPTADIIFFRAGASSAVRIARAFEDAGFRVVNDSRFIQLSCQKYLANIHANANGIPIPALNVLIEKHDTELLSVYLRQHGSLVAKPVMSRNMGRHVYLIRSPRDFSDVAEIPGSRVILQSEVTFNRLVRTIVTSDGMLAAATIYDTKRGSWKATVCANPLAQSYRQVPATLVSLAEKTLRAFGGDIAYIDYFETSQGYVFSEINQACNLLRQEHITGFPIADRLAAFLVAIQAQRVELAHYAFRGDFYPGRKAVMQMRPAPDRSRRSLSSHARSGPLPRPSTDGRETESSRTHQIGNADG
jgi:glutathione synthase/RimK-type ligase-like ATP-grasp enzyme